MFMELSEMRLSKQDVEQAVEFWLRCTSIYSADNAPDADRPVRITKGQAFHCQHTRGGAVVHFTGKLPASQPDQREE